MLTLADLAEKLNKPPSTVHSWAAKGVMIGGVRVKLQTIRIGGLRHVTGAAWRAFKAGCNPEPVATPRPLSAKRAAADQAAAARLLGGGG